MKNLFTFLASMIFLTNAVSGQVPMNHLLSNFNGNVNQPKTLFYSFTTDTETYSHLTNPIQLEGISACYDYGPINLTFDFKLFNTSINTITFDLLGASLVSELNFDTTFIFRSNSVDFLDKDFNNVDTFSYVKYAIEGSPGSRICKIEWKNVGSFKEGPPYNMYLNLQLWLYEGSNIVEWHFGPSSITNTLSFFNPYLGPICGLICLTSSSYIFELITGTIQNPQLTNNQVSLEGYPTNGTIYRLTPSTSNIADYQTQNFIIYPNPVQDMLNIETKQANNRVTVFDYTGKLIQSQMISESGAIDVSTIKSGIYIVKIENGGITSTQKFVKQ
jgi:hypothetical protein